MPNRSSLHKGEKDVDKFQSCLQQWPTTNLTRLWNVIEWSVRKKVAPDIGRDPKLLPPNHEVRKPKSLSSGSLCAKKSLLRKFHKMHFFPSQVVLIFFFGLECVIGSPLKEMRGFVWLPKDLRRSDKVSDIPASSAANKLKSSKGLCWIVHAFRA